MIKRDPLERAHDLLTKRLRRHDRWQAMKPVRDSMISTSPLTSGPGSNMLADAEAKLRQSTARLEESAKTYEARAKEAEDRKQSDLSLLRRRTELLREWLEMLS